MAETVVRSMKVSWTASNLYILDTQAAKELAFLTARARTAAKQAHSGLTSPMHLSISGAQNALADPDFAGEI